VTTLWTEDWTGSNGSSWAGRWSSSGTTPNAPDIQSNQGRMRTGTTAFGTYSRSVASGETAKADHGVLVKLSFDNPKISEFFVVGVRSSTTFNGTFPNDGYIVELEINNNQFTLRRTVSGTATTLQTVSKTFSAGTAVWVRLQAIGTAVKAKIWNDGSSEPGSWDAEQTDSNVTAAGYVVLSALPGTTTAATGLWDSLTAYDTNASVSVAAIAASASMPAVAARAGASASVGAIGGTTTIPAPTVQAESAGKFHQLIDNFGSSIDAKWDTAGGGVAWSGGHVEIDEDVTPNEIFTTNHYDLTGSHVSARFEFPAVVNGPVFIMQVADTQTNGGPNYFGFVRSNVDVLSCIVSSSGISSEFQLTYDPTDHLYLRLSEDNGNIYWWTSPDGQAWTEQHSAGTPVWAGGLTAAYLNFFVISFGTNLGQVVELDSINGNGNAAVSVGAIRATTSFPDLSVRTGVAVAPGSISARATIPSVGVSIGPAQRDFIEDPFTGVDGDLTTPGRTAVKWQAMGSSDADVTGNQVTGNSAFALDRFRTVDYFPLDDMSVSITLDTLDDSNDRSAAVLLRCSDTTETYYYVEVNEQNNRHQVVRFINGVGSAVSGFVGLPEPLSLPATLTGEVRGNRIRVYLNDELLAEYTDNTITTGKRAGFALYNSAGVARIDDFSAYHLGNAVVHVGAIQATTRIPTPAISSGLNSIPGLISRWTAQSLALANGAAVSTWARSAGVQTASLTSSGSNRPTFVTGAVNGLPAVRFTRTSESVGQWMDSGNWTQTYAVPLTIFCVFKAASLAGQNMDLWSGRFVNNQPVYTHASINGQSRVTVGAGGYGTLTNATILDTGNYHAVGVVYNGANSKIFFDSLTATATGSTNQNSTSAMPGIMFGANTQHAGSHLDGFIAEMIVVQGAMSDADMAGVMGQLGIRYGLPWAPEPEEQGPPPPPEEGSNEAPEPLDDLPSFGTQPTPHIGVVFDAGYSSIVTLPLQGLGPYVNFECASLANIPGLLVDSNTTPALAGTLVLSGNKALTLTRKAGTGTGFISTLFGFDLGSNVDNREYLFWFQVRPGAGASNRSVSASVYWAESADDFDVFDPSDTHTQTQGTGYVDAKGYTWVGLRSRAPAGTRFFAYTVQVLGVPEGETHCVGGWSMRYFGTNIASRLKHYDYKRGRPSDLGTTDIPSGPFEAGSGHITLNNNDHLFTSTDSGYEFDLRQQVTIIVEFQGNLFPRFVGYVDDWENQITSSSANITIELVDYFNILTSQKLYPPYQSFVRNPQLKDIVVPRTLQNIPQEYFPAFVPPPRVYFPLGEQSGSTVAGSIAGEGGSGVLVTSTAGGAGTSFGQETFEPVLRSEHTADGDIGVIRFNPNDITGDRGEALVISPVSGATVPVRSRSWTAMFRFAAPVSSQTQTIFRSYNDGSPLQGFHIEMLADGRLQVFTSNNTVTTTNSYDTDTPWTVTVRYDHTVGSWGRVNIRIFFTETALTLTGNPFPGGAHNVAHLGAIYNPFFQTVTLPYRGRLAHACFWDEYISDAAAAYLETVISFGMEGNEYELVRTIAGLAGLATEYMRLDAGLSPMRPLHWDQGSSPLTLMQKYQGYAGGVLFIGPDGAIVTQNRLRRANPTSRFSYTGLLAPLESEFTEKLNRARLANSVDVRQVGGGSYRYEEPTSVAKYGEISAGLFELPINSIPEVDSFGKAVRDTRSFPKVETSSVTFLMDGLKPDLITTLLRTEISDLVTVGNLPEFASKTETAGFVEEIEVTAESAYDEHVTFSMSDPRTALVYGTIPDVTEPPPPVDPPPDSEPPDDPPPTQPDGFWASGGSADTNNQASTIEWENWRQRVCTLQLCYNTRSAGWGAFMPSGGQPAAFSRPNLRLLIQTSPFPENVGATYAALISGAYDSQWTQFGQILKDRDQALGRLPTIVSVAWEMNGDYMPWGHGNGGGKYSQASTYVQGFRRIVGCLRAAYPNIKIAWVTNGHANPVPASDLYPGDAYCDYVGTDYYDMYPDAPTPQAFDAEAVKPNAGIRWYLDFARAHSKLLIIPEWGIAPGSTGGNTVGDNPLFIEKMFQVFQDAHATGHLGGECYFNDAKDGSNVDSDLIHGGNPRSAAKYLQLY